MFQRNRRSKGHPGSLEESHVLQYSSHEPWLRLRFCSDGSGWVFSGRRVMRMQFLFGDFHPLTHISHPVGESFSQSEYAKYWFLKEMFNQRFGTFLKPLLLWDPPCYWWPKIINTYLPVMTCDSESSTYPNQVLRAEDQMFSVTINTPDPPLNQSIHQLPPL